MKLLAIIFIFVLAGCSSSSPKKTETTDCHCSTLRKTYPQSDKNIFEELSRFDNDNQLDNSSSFEFLDDLEWLVLKKVIPSEQVVQLPSQIVLHQQSITISFIEDLDISVTPIVSEDYRYITLKLSFLQKETQVRIPDKGIILIKVYPDNTEEQMLVSLKATLTNSSKVTVVIEPYLLMVTSTFIAKSGFFSWQQRWK